jgi:hypothetical protein
MAVTTADWEGLFGMLTTDNLDLMMNWLKNPSEAAESGPERSVGEQRKSTPGLKKQKNGYQAKIVLDNFIIFTYTQDLERAIDAYIALQRIKARVHELRSHAGSATFDDAIRKAVAEVRAAEQVSAFWMQYQFEIAGTIKMDSNHWKRYTTPTTADVNLALSHRAELLYLSQQKVEEHSECPQDQDDARARVQAMAQAQARARVRAEHQTKMEAEAMAKTQREAEVAKEVAAVRALLHQRVRIDGLSGRPELNGRYGKTTRYVTDKSRFAVTLEGDDESVLLKPANLTKVDPQPTAEDPPPLS